MQAMSGLIRRIQPRTKTPGPTVHCGLSTSSELTRMCPRCLQFEIRSFREVSVWLVRDSKSGGGKLPWEFKSPSGILESRI